jgi:DNA mismatch repair protein MutS
VSLKGTGQGALPPLLAQYVKLRDEYAEYILLFQVGDFFEAFGEDAERLSKLLNITLTHKSSKDFDTPMSGIPVRAAETHIERLLKLGHRVAVAEQTEVPSAGKNLVEREVTQLITPGTVSSDAILRGEENFLAAIASGDGYALALLDVTTGEFRCCTVSSRGALYDELAKYRPAEVLLAPELDGNASFASEFGARFAVMRSTTSFELGDCADTLLKQFGSLPAVLETVGLQRACGAVIAYAARVTDQATLPSVTRLVRFDPGATMRLGDTAARALELFEPVHPNAPKDATLFGTLNLTRTASGRRRLRAWLRAPLLDLSAIHDRTDAVDAFYSNAPERQAVRALLYRSHDLERLQMRVATERASARDLSALLRTLEIVPELLSNIPTGSSRLLRDIAARLDPLPEVVQYISAALVPDPPLKLTEGGLIRDGFDAQLDAQRSSALGGRNWIAALETQERERTGIPVKIGFNAVFGYYLEVTNAHRDRVPGDYRAVATLKDRQRYTRADLRDKEREVLLSDAGAQRREYEVFVELRAGLVPFTERLQLLAVALAELDVITALAEVAATRGYVKPVLKADGETHVVEARHAVVEAALPNEQRFVPNDLHVTPASRFTLLTGPNMSGKSTYLRQSALLSIMAQIGSFVPARAATLRVFDRIYTRIGASDDLAGGSSTFMVEMKELARILHGVTPQSLVILDEIGRGTSTFDGLAIAWAASECLIESGATVLFATHYFELTRLEHEFPGVVNLHVAAQEEAQQGLRFYHQVMPGPASRSYGVQVARLAGLPPGAVERAEALLHAFQTSSESTSNLVAAELAGLDLSRLTGLGALALLETWQRRLRQPEDAKDKTLASG